MGVKPVGTRTRGSDCHPYSHPPPPAARSRSHRLRSSPPPTSPAPAHPSYLPRASLHPLPHGHTGGEEDAGPPPADLLTMAAGGDRVRGAGRSARIVPWPGSGCHGTDPARGDTSGEEEVREEAATATGRRRRPARGAGSGRDGGTLLRAHLPRPSRRPPLPALAHLSLRRLLPRRRQAACAPCPSRL